VIPRFPLHRSKVLLEAWDVAQLERIDRLLRDAGYRRE